MFRSLRYDYKAISAKTKNGLQKGFEPIMQCESMRRKIYEMHSVVVIHDVSPGSFAKYLGGDKRHTENYAVYGVSSSFLEFQYFLDKKCQEESLIAYISYFCLKVS